VDFGEIVCYSQTVILIVLAIGYLVNMRNKTAVSSKVEIKCPSCGYIIKDQNVQYCAKCGNMLSHSEGLSLEK
jgi:rRNA maturation endonuclease Nob1